MTPRKWVLVITNKVLFTSKLNNHYTILAYHKFWRLNCVINKNVKLRILPKTKKNDWSVRTCSKTFETTYTETLKAITNLQPSCLFVNLWDKMIINIKLFILFSNFMALSFSGIDEVTAGWLLLNAPFQFPSITYHFPPSLGFQVYLSLHYM